MCKKFEFSDLNKTQKEVLTQVVLKKKDIFVSLPTGFGKSVIVQALPIVSDSYTGKSGHIAIVVIVSPLLSLIKDQCERLRDRGISSISKIQHPERRKFCSAGVLFSKVAYQRKRW